MDYINWAVSIAAIIGLIIETSIIIGRNKKIAVKGKDDFFTFTLVLLFAILIFPYSASSTTLESIRNTIIIVFIFATLGIKRGLTQRGIEKICYTIPWEKIKAVRIDSYQNTKIMTIFETDNRKYKLIFHKFQLKKVLTEVEKHVDNIYIQSSLDELLRGK